MLRSLLLPIRVFDHRDRCGKHGATQVGYATFYKHYADKEAAFLALLDAAIERGLGDVEGAYQREEGPWADRVGAALGALFADVAAHPAAARAVLVEAVAAGSEAAAKHEGALKRLAPLLRPGRELNPRQAQLPESLEETLAGGVVWVLGQRLIAGLAAAVAEKGYAAVTLADIVKQAKVSRRVFYANFESKEQCFLAAFEVVLAHLRELVAVAVEPADGWPQRAIAATRATLAFLAAEPDLARLCLVESRAAGPAVAARFNEAVGELTPLLAQGRAERPAGERPLPDSTEDSTIGSLVSLAYRKTAAGEAEQLEDLLPDCAELALLPYLGPAEAARLAREAV